MRSANEAKTEKRNTERRNGDKAKTSQEQNESTIKQSENETKATQTRSESKTTAKQNMQLFVCFRPMKNSPKRGPGVLFLLIKTLPTFWAERILIL